MSKEKKHLKYTILAALAIILIYLGLQIATRSIHGKDLVTEVFSDNSLRTYSIENMETIVGDESIISISDLTYTDGRTCVTVSPVNKGQTYLEILDHETDDIVYFDYFTVTSDGIIVSLSTGNFSNYELSLRNMLILITGFAVLLWSSAIITYYKLRYSYHTIFYIGFGAWITVLDILLMICAFEHHNMLTVYMHLRRAATNFIYITFPLILVFSVLMCISNIQLIRHEGKGIRRMLGIFLSAIMVSGAGVLYALDSLTTGGSELKMDIWSTVINCLSCVYILLECFLFGSIVCGSLSAKHTPAYDRDYVIILGCKVRPDGTLYPLIQSRVDRAIGFVRRQLEKTGKQAILIPSGGRGNDETISEAEAMQRYLIEQGIEEKNILVENKARNTRENMLLSKALIDERTENARIAFATTNYHVLRSGIISRQVNVEADGMGSHTKWYFWPNAYIREVIGMLSYKRKTLVAILIPLILFIGIVQFVF